MDALVAVESVFGNTRAIADAIADGLAERMTVRVVDVATAPSALGGADLLVVGGPTHAFGMSRPGTRAAAAAEVGSGATAAEVGLREWLEALPTGTVPAASFDTCIDRPRMPGSAAARAHRLLRRRGYRMIARRQTFRVAGTPGPLVDGELERATAWGSGLATQLAGSAQAERSR
ncbi:flavodoxin family protein [Pseudonocardia sp. GCM10023141]|uniref:flavodoxin family protein n=1 Tax=Pseudonocardia sp. GCM10023141 TaxID=3252653 RepID=UPI0036147916